VRSVAIHPDNTTVYAGAEDGIYVSRDRGLNWNILSNALGTGETQGLVVDPGNPRAIYATKWGQGVYRSIDGGISWDLGNGGLSDTQLFDLDLHPQNASILYAATWSGVFRSVDAGANWVELNSPSGRPEPNHHYNGRLRHCTLDRRRRNLDHSQSRPGRRHAVCWYRHRAGRIGRRLCGLGK
jgi:hypothetical protein